jgi:formate hydrogenlyase subunit 3/multisubunit Na+/H+ antiporter MnhD subunit
LPALLIAPLAVGTSLVIYPSGFKITLLLDAPGALLLGGAALLWSAAGVFARAQLGSGPAAQRFAAWWLLTLAGCLGVFIAGDLLSFYLAFAVVSLAAFGLVAHDGTEKARRAGGLYLLLAVVGEIALLLAFALLHGRAGIESVAIADVAPVLRTTPGGAVIALLLILGFGIKMGLMPLHVWLPIAHPAAPAPGSAVLSGAIIKAGVIGLIRFLPFDAVPLAEGALLAALGFATAYWGVAMGLTQRNPKTILAYSSVSQMGVVAATLGMGLFLGLAETPLHAAFYALHHMLAKGALFLGVGLALASGPTGRLWRLAAHRRGFGEGRGQARTRRWAGRDGGDAFRLRVHRADAAFCAKAACGDGGGAAGHAALGPCRAVAGFGAGGAGAALGALWRGDRQGA